MSLGTGNPHVTQHIADILIFCLLRDYQKYMHKMHATNLFSQTITQPGTNLVDKPCI